jgi:hypothetical protein
MFISLQAEEATSFSLIRLYLALERSNATDQLSTLAEFG